MDCLLKKVDAIGPKLAAGFSGSIDLGFDPQTAHQDFRGLESLVERVAILAAPPGAVVRRLRRLVVALLGTRQVREEVGRHLARAAGQRVAVLGARHPAPVEPCGDHHVHTSTFITEVTGRTVPPRAADDDLLAVFAIGSEVDGMLRGNDEPMRSLGVTDGTDSRRDLGTLWHALAGLAIGALGALFGWITAACVMVALAAGGWGREVVQHDLKLTGHQWFEAMAWPIGGAVGAALSLGAQALL